MEKAIITFETIEDYQAFLDHMEMGEVEGIFEHPFNIQHCQSNTVNLTEGEG